MKLRLIHPLILLSIILAAACTPKPAVRQQASMPANAIPFIFDSHLYFPGSINDSLDVMLIFDSGADMLYLDQDYTVLSGFRNLPLRMGKAVVSGAGDGRGELVDMVWDTLRVSLGAAANPEWMSVCPYSPILNLRQMLGRHIDAVIGNNWLFERVLEVNFDGSYLSRHDTLTEAMLQGYRRIPVTVAGNRIDVEATLKINDSNVVRGKFRFDMGCGGALVLTKAAGDGLHLTEVPKAFFKAQHYGLGGGGTGMEIRAEWFSLFDTLAVPVVACSLNREGALSEGLDYVGLLGNGILSQYDWFIDAPNQTLWARPNRRENDAYRHSSKTQMGSVDRTDICEGWIVNSLFVDGIAEKAGIEIGDTIMAINGRPVREILWEEQRRGLNLKGLTRYTLRKKTGETKDAVLFIDGEVLP
ncbi:MAG: PDZ domain-containing protein [Bacteroides sp.]|nr:PDZ domain-containing protein [Bacteroides sp.]